MIDLPGNPSGTPGQWTRKVPFFHHRLGVARHGPGEILKKKPFVVV